ncbi:AbaSI family restriction endonuclease [Microbacterium sp. NPDC089696]|uniref:AbaSI family restriction endonuclease n=1 Tax=Microbacterium sp. NPDC089696 TaxID=3364199 RepID=UPI00380BBA43
MPETATVAVSPLDSMFAQARGTMAAFIDESYRTPAQALGGNSFYVLAAVLFPLAQLEVIRERLRAIVGSGRWHTTDAAQSDAGQARNVQMSSALAHTVRLPLGHRPEEMQGRRNSTSRAHEENAAILRDLPLAVTTMRAQPDSSYVLSDALASAETPPLFDRVVACARRLRAGGGTMSTNARNNDPDTNGGGATTRTRKRWVMPTEVDFYARMLSSISGKGHEVYAVSRVLHLLADPEIELVTQQPIRLRDGKLALLDLYLPQFGVGVEVNERHHITSANKQFDHARQHAVAETAGIQIRVVGEADASSLDDLKEQVDELIDEIRQWKKGAIDSGTFVPFFYGNRYDPMYWRSVGQITTRDDAQMPRTPQVCALFGKNHLHYQHATMSLGTDLQLWMPVLEQRGRPSRDDWKNTLSPDEMTIEEVQKRDGSYTYDPDLRSVTFAKFKDPVTLAEYYRFLGVFKVVGISQTDDPEPKKLVTYKRVADVVDLTVYPDPPARA